MLGLDSFQQAQVISYLAEYRRNTFGIGAPTDAIRLVGGREPEPFSVIARRYVSERPEARRTLGNWTAAVGDAMRILFTPGLDLERLIQSWAPTISSALAADSASWRMAHNPPIEAGLSSAQVP